MKALPQQDLRRLKSLRPPEASLPPCPGKAPMSEAVPKRNSTSQAIAAVQKEEAMRGVLLWLLGIPIPIIILLYVFHVV